MYVKSDKYLERNAGGGGESKYNSNRHLNRQRTWGYRPCTNKWNLFRVDSGTAQTDGLQGMLHCCTVVYSMISKWSRKCNTLPAIKVDMTIVEFITCLAFTY